MIVRILGVNGIFLWVLVRFEKELGRRKRRNLFILHAVMEEFF